MSQLRYLPDVVTLALDRELCDGCAMCTKVCPQRVLRMEDKRASIADRDACMECGACARNCSTAALSVQAGVGCAAGIINGILRRDGGGGCDCYVDPKNPQAGNTGCC